MVAVGGDNSWSLVEASAIAGVVTRSLLHPIDTCKVVNQVSTASTSPRGLFATTRGIVKHQGMRGLYQGFPVALVGTVPGVTLYFTSFNLIKGYIDNRVPSYPNMSNFAAGFLAEVVSCVIWVPTDVVKERAQATQAAISIRNVLKSDGWKGLYRGYGATLASFGPFSAFYFMFAEQLKDHYSRAFMRPRLSFYELMPLCAIAGGAAAFCSAPMDLVKVRMQVERSAASTYQGFIPSLTKIWRTEGLRGLFRGGGSRVWFAVPNTAITMSLLESIKSRLD